MNLSPLSNRPINTSQAGSQMQSSTLNQLIGNPPCKYLKDKLYYSFDSLPQKIPSVTVLSSEDILPKTANEIFFLNTTLKGESPAYLSAKKHLDKPKFREFFEESERVHLLQMMLFFKENIPEGSEKALIEWFKTVKEELGDEVALLISNPICYKRASIQDAIKLMQQLVEMSADLEEIFPLLERFFDKFLSLETLLNALETLKKKLYAKKYPEKDLDEVFEAFRGKRAGALVEFPLKENELTIIRQEYEEIERLGKEIAGYTLAQIVSRFKELQKRAVDGLFDTHDKCELLALGREAIRIHFSIFPYNTQILTILGLFQFPSHLKGKIAQVKTGEGKSTIFTLLAFYFACQGRYIDLIGSSRSLSMRDQKKYEEFFRIFGISTSHICEDKLTEENFKGQIIYGTNYDFEFALMRDCLGQENLRRIRKNGEVLPRPADVALVDEADNLFIDCARNSARIAIPGRNELNWVYKPILNFVQTHLKHIQAIHQEIGLDRKIGQRLRIEYLKDIPALEAEYFSLLYQNGMQEAYENFIRMLCEELMQCQGGKFKEKVESLNIEKIQSWFHSAFTALYEKKEGEDYVIKPVESLTSEGKKYRNKIVIVDKENTGQRQEMSRWQNGLHEFLEAKHDLKIEEESLMPASLSHPIFFQDYPSIFGLTGTMGTVSERQEIVDVYGIETFDVPPHRPNLRIELDPILTFNEATFNDALLQEVATMKKLGRPLILFFQTIRETEEFQAFLKTKGYFFNQVLNDRQVADEEIIVAKAGAPHMITIATNMAGRGMDIILHPTSLANGGLHAVFTFLPENDRVENQGFGRAARQGQPGSARLILQLPASLSHTTNLLSQLKSQRAHKVHQLSKYRKEAFEIAKINHSYLKRFFKLSQNWQKTINETFLEGFEYTFQFQAERLSKNPDDRLIPQQTLVQQDKRMLALRKNFLHYVKNYSDSSGISWKPFLEKLRKAIQIRFQQDWAEYFYDRLDDLYASCRKDGFKGKELENEYANRVKTLYHSIKSINNVDASALPNYKKTYWHSILKYPQSTFCDYAAFIWKWKLPEEEKDVPLVKKSPKNNSTTGDLLKDCLNNYTLEERQKILNQALSLRSNLEEIEKVKMLVKAGAFPDGDLMNHIVKKDQPFLIDGLLPPFTEVARFLRQVRLNKLYEEAQSYFKNKFLAKECLAYVEETLESIKESIDNEILFKEKEELTTENRPGFFHPVFVQTEAFFKEIALKKYGWGLITEII